MQGTPSDAVHRGAGRTDTWAASCTRFRANRSGEAGRGAAHAGGGGATERTCGGASLSTCARPTSGMVVTRSCQWRGGQCRWLAGFGADDRPSSTWLPPGALSVVFPGQGVPRPATSTRGRGSGSICVVGRTGRDAVHWMRAMRRSLGHCGSHRRTMHGTGPVRVACPHPGRAAAHDAAHCIWRVRHLTHSPAIPSALSRPAGAGLGASSPPGLARPWERQFLRPGRACTARPRAHGLCAGWGIRIHCTGCGAGRVQLAEAAN